MILDASKKAEQRALLEAELEAVGIRLNQEPPSVPLWKGQVRIFSVDQLQQHIPEAKEGWRYEDYVSGASQKS